jgi:TolA-binding protein
VSSARGGEAEDQYRVAAGHYSRGQWDLASEAFVDFVKRFPDHAKADQSIFFLAEALLQQNEPERARTRFDEYVRRAPQGPYAKSCRFRLGEASYLAGDFERARKDLEAFQRDYPRDPRIVYVLPYLGEMSLAKGKPREAVKWFRLALTRFPAGPLRHDCRLGLARSLQNSGEPEKAIEIYRELAAKRLGPLSSEARYRLGSLQYTLGKHALAIETLRPLDTDASAGEWGRRAPLVRAMALRKLKRLDEAAGLLEHLIEDPDLGVEARYWLAAIHKDRRQWDKAADLLVMTAEQYPDHRLAGAVRFHAGHALLRAGRFDEAAEQFDLVLKNESRYRRWRDDAAMGKIQLAVLVKAHKAVDAQAERFLSRFPKSRLAADARRAWARALIERRDYRKASEVLSPLVGPDRNRPHGEQSRYLLALAYRGMGRHAKALELLADIESPSKRRSTTTMDARLLRASLLMDLDRFTEAIGPLEDLLAASPLRDRAARAQAQLAICLARCNKRGAADAALTALVEAHPTQADSLAAIEQLAEIAYERGDWARAERRFRMLADHGANKLMVDRGLSGIGWTQWSRGRFAEAADTFEKLLARKPEDRLAACAGWARAYALEKLGRTDDALAMYHSVIEDYPENSQSFKVLLSAARLSGRLGRNEQAAGLYRQIAGKFPKHTGIDAVLYEWSWALSDQGKNDEAEPLLERLNRDYPKSRYWADATYRLAERALAAGKFTRAEELADSILAAKDSSEIEQYTLALKWQIAVARGRWGVVEKTARRLIERYPQSTFRSAAEFWAAESLYRRGDYGRALTAFDSLAKKRGGKQESWRGTVPLRRAQILALRKQWTEALRTASGIRGQYPDFENQYEADYVVGRALAARADFEGARRAYRRVVTSSHGAKTETAAMAQWMIGETYFHQKDYRAAAREYLRAEILYDYPRWQAASLLQAGKCYEQLGRPADAARLYRRLVEHYPKTQFVAEAQKRLGASEARQPKHSMAKR